MIYLNKIPFQTKKKRRKKIYYAQCEPTIKLKFHKILKNVLKKMLKLCKDTTNVKNQCKK
jgi:hypothetical protein